MKRLSAFVAVLVFVSLSVAAPPTITTVPAPVPFKWTDFKTDAGRQLIFSVGDKAAKWVLADDGAQLTPDSNGKSAVFSSDKPGVYKFLATVGEETTGVRVTVGGVLPPIDQLAKKVADAYKDDTSVTKAVDKTSLANAYRAVAEQVDNIDTAGNLAIVIENSRRARVGDRLATVRVLFGREFDALIPKTPNTVLTAAHKTTAISELNRYAAILEEVK